MAKSYTSKRYKDWEMVEIRTKPRGLRKSRTLRVKSTSAVEEETDARLLRHDESLTASVDSITFEDAQSLRANADRATQQLATCTCTGSQETQTSRLSTTQLVSLAHTSTHERITVYSALRDAPLRVGG